MDAYRGRLCLRYLELDRLGSVWLEGMNGAGAYEFGEGVLGLAGLTVGCPLVPELVQEQNGLDEVCPGSFVWLLIG